MSGFATFAFVILFIATIVFLVAWLLSKITHKPNFSTGKRTGIIAVAAIVFMIIGVSTMPQSKKQNTQRKEAVAKSSSEASSKKESSSKQSSEKQVNSKSSSKKAIESSSKKLEAINSEIADQVAEGQGFAAGTLDENGNSTDSGTPNAEFAGYLAVDSVTYNQAGGITIQVNDNFSLLDDATKTSEMNKVQNMAVVAVGNHKKLSTQDYSDGLYTAVHYGTQSVGHSKILDSHEYKWKD
ncbi:hypothetical protein [Paucilactobacillus nenjiangensis]|uniref:hypothetical protein n=1 Tax=Paucilactobacillus nenjiangensis TaxID=1296540 RepID=UPI003BB4F394